MPMKRSPLKRGTSQLKRTPLKKSGKTKEKKVARQKAFYSSAAWKKLRKEALERAGNQCEYIVSETDSVACCCSPVGFRCDNTEHLQVHHTGSHFGGNERPEHLRCLCRYHHAIVEARDFPHRQRSR